MSKRIVETVAGQWFLNTEDSSRLKTGRIPKKVLLSLSKLSLDEIKKLSEEICWDCYWDKFHEEMLKPVVEANSTNESSEKKEIDEEAFSNYIKSYKHKFFPYLDDEEEMVENVAVSMSSIFQTVLFWCSGLIKINNHFDIFDVAEKNTIIDKSGSFYKRSMINQLLVGDGANFNKIDFDKIKETDCKMLIMGAIRQSNKEEFYKLTSKYNKTQERMKFE